MGFDTLERAAGLYFRRPDTASPPRAPAGRFKPFAATRPATSLDRPRTQARPSLRELTERALLQQIVAAGVLVDGAGDILYLHGRTGMFLEPAPGDAGNNILRMAREGLHLSLSGALRKAATGAAASVTGLRVKTNGHFTHVDLTVAALPIEAGAPPGDAPLYLVTLREAPAAVATVAEAMPAEDAHVAALQHELRLRDEQLQTAQNELVSSTEEMRSSNAELQSLNEELQSTNEELETSSEELQSVNEELATVNAELQTKVADLARANDDMNNLLAGTGIGTLFVDHELRILRFTPAASGIMNLIHSDVGRPLAHIAPNLASANALVADVRSVLDTLVPKEQDVQTTDGKWYLMRIQPYRTLENVIEGVVVSFIEITETVRTREALRTANAHLRLAVVVRDAHDAITVQDLTGRTTAWNPGAVRMYGWSEAEALAMNVRARIPLGRAAAQELQVVRQLATAHEVLEPFRTQRLSKDGTVVEIWLTATALMNEHQELFAIATTERLSG
ncbi:MAG: PAS domain-containing protein [Proteobacteria bacterium]|nr:PAS domain-containing protein [Pseudomonadota bacterium]